MGAKTNAEIAKYNSVNDIKRAYAMNNGGHWFSRDTIKYHGSRFSQTVYGGRFFVSSEWTSSDRDSRAYTVRFINDDCEIRTSGEFGQHTTLAKAQSAARAAARKYTETGKLPE